MMIANKRDEPAHYILPYLLEQNAAKTSFIHGSFTSAAIILRENRDYWQMCVRSSLNHHS